MVGAGGRRRAKVILGNRAGIAMATARRGVLHEPGDHRDSPAAGEKFEERFESRVLPLFKRQTEQVRELIPELYLHGLASGDFELALRGLLGEGAPLSASSLQRLKEKWQGEYEQWKGTPIQETDWAYLWADGITVKAGLGKEKAALLVVMESEGWEQTIFGLGARVSRE